MTLTQTYQNLAQILEYPKSDFKDLVAKSQSLLQTVFPEQIEAFLPFQNYVAEQDAERLEELYVQTFDVGASCSLDVGYLMFGEDYKRGQFMAELKVLEKQFAVDCGSELPDHLPNVLKLLTKMSFADASELVHHFVAPATEKMMKTFDESRNVYAFPLKVVHALIKRDFLEP